MSTGARPFPRQIPRAAPPPARTSARHPFCGGTYAVAASGLLLLAAPFDIHPGNPIARSPTLSDTRAAIAQAIALPPCQATGRGRDYVVGNGPGEIPELALVPWERLGPGDTVRLRYRPQPYRGRFMLSGNGSRAAPIRVCGIPGPAGERPWISGEDAATRESLDYGHETSEARATVFIGRRGSDDWTSTPSHILIDGLRINGAHPDHAFVDTSSRQRHYDGFSACIWIDRGHHITVADNEITDCAQAIFGRSTDDGPFARTMDVHVAGNDMHGNGVDGSIHLHTTYIQAMGVVYEFNRYGPLRPGAAGNSIKDRSAGTVIRYNRIEDGARAIDLVEAEDFAEAAKADPAYRSTFVYGNQIVKDGRKGSTIHYGGDHNGSTPGQHWGEPNNRKGTLYFYHNTVRVTGDGYAVLFQLSTTEEHASVFNNVFIFDPSVPAPLMRSDTEVGSHWKSGGTLTLGRNWITRGWRDRSSGSFAEPLQGTGELIQGLAPPVNTRSFMPPADSPVVDAAVPLPPAVSAHPVLYQLDAQRLPVPRVIRGKAPDLGALER